jgi:hypothetical protein
MNVITTSSDISESKKNARHLAKVVFRTILASLPIDTTFLFVQAGFPVHLLGIGRRILVAAEVPPVCVLILERSSFVGSEFPEALPSATFFFNTNIPNKFKKMCETITAPKGTTRGRTRQADDVKDRTKKDQGQNKDQGRNKDEGQTDLHNLRLIRLLHVVRPTGGFLLSKTTFL